MRIVEKSHRAQVAGAKNMQISPVCGKVHGESSRGSFTPAVWWRGSAAPDSSLRGSPRRVGIGPDRRSGMSLLLLAVAARRTGRSLSATARLPTLGTPTP